jgi:predicted PurR-regulated permease PerM
MTLSPRVAFLSLFALVIIWFFYAERAILSPFILAAIFAYLFNPIITFVSEKLRIPRTVTILIVYGTLIGLFIFATFQVSTQVFEESSELRTFATHTLLNAKTQLVGLPDWARPTAYQLLTELQHSRFLNFFTAPSLFPFVSQAISRVISFFIFLFSGFYFLKDGGKFFQQLVWITPDFYKKNVQDFLTETNTVLSKYLRGQIFLIILMGAVTYISLAILGIKFSVSIAIFSGFAEIVPVVGPIIAGAVAATVALLTGHAHFGLSPLNAAIAVVVIYFVLRHLEDYFVIPHIMGSITKLPPFVIFFAVVAGGHLAGILGLILAVPVAAILRILLEFSYEQFFKSGSRK